MDHVSRPLLAVLVATVAFFALWVVALKPSSSSTTGRSSGLGAYKSAINQARHAVATSNAANTAEGGGVATTQATSGAARHDAAPRSQSTSHARGTLTARTTASSPASVTKALNAGKVAVLLFYNPAATDDKAVKQELAAVPTHSGKVVKLALPLSGLARYKAITNQVPVLVSPTLVVVDTSRQASTIVGFADRFEISQRISDALAG
jgi:hypothetical protein